MQFNERQHSGSMPAFSQPADPFLVNNYLSYPYPTQFYQTHRFLPIKTKKRLITRWIKIKKNYLLFSKFFFIKLMKKQMKHRKKPLNFLKTKELTRSTTYTSSPHNIIAIITDKKLQSKAAFYWWQPVKS